MMPKYDNPIVLLNDLILWFNAIKDWLPSFHQRMINRERRLRLRHAEGNITDKRLDIELKAIKQRKAAKGTK
jgi:hypothetical protein